MLNTKRLVIATIMGFITGFICYGFASSGPQILPSAVAWQIIFSRALIGFAIGISIFRIGHWSIHGAVMGFIFSIPLAFSNLMAPDSPDYSKSSMFIASIVMGIIYGVLIELVTTVFFKAGIPGQAKA